MHRKLALVAALVVGFLAGQLSPGLSLAAPSLRSPGAAPFTPSKAVWASVFINTHLHRDDVFCDPSDDADAVAVRCDLMVHNSTTVADQDEMKQSIKSWASNLELWSPGFGAVKVKYNVTNMDRLIRR